MSIAFSGRVATVLSAVPTSSSYEKYQMWYLLLLLECRSYLPSLLLEMQHQLGFQTLHLDHQ